MKAPSAKLVTKMKPAANCTSVPPTNTNLNTNYYLLADSQRLLYGTLVPPVRRQLLSSSEEEAVEERGLVGSPTADQCYATCLTFLQYGAPFYCSTSPNGCYYSRSSTLIYDSPSTVRQKS